MDGGPLYFLLLFSKEHCKLRFGWCWKRWKRDAMNGKKWITLFDVAN